MTLAAGATCTLTYGSLPTGATAPSSPGLSTFTTSEASSATGTLTQIAHSPTVRVGNDGTGTLTVSPDHVTAGSTGTLTFTYTAANSMSSGELTVGVPAGWSTPTTGSGPGSTTSTCGTAGVSGSTIQVTGVTLNTGLQCTISYTGVAPGPGGTSYPFNAQQESTNDNDLLPLTSSPSVQVTAPPSEQLAVTINGHGTVSFGGGSPCQQSCSRTFSRGTALTLTGTPAAGYRFSGWSGACHGAGSCHLTLTADTATTATFTKISGPACVVPKLKGKTLSQARTLLGKAHCSLGKVSKPKSKHQKLVVGSTKPHAGTKLSHGAKVVVTLVKKK